MIKTTPTKLPGVCGGPLPVVRCYSTNIDILLDHSSVSAGNQPAISHLNLLVCQSTRGQPLRWYKCPLFSAEAITVNFLYSGHCRDLELVSSLARVRNSGSLFQSNVCNLVFPGI